MKTVVYLDVLLVTNFLAGYFLLRAAAKLAGAACPPARALAGAGVAAASTLILLAPALPGPLSLLYKLGSAALVTLAAFGWHGARNFLRAGLWFFLLNLGLAGLCLLGAARGGMDGMRVHNLTVYVDLSPLTLVLAVLGMYLALRLILLLFGPPADGEPWRLWLELAGGARLEAQALYDTGFFLRDPLGGRQTLLVSWPAVKGQLGAAWNAWLEAYFRGDILPPPPEAALRLVPCAGAAGSRALPGFLAGNVRLECGQRTLLARNVTVVFAPEPLRGGQFQALFGREFLAGETERRRSMCT